MTIKASDISIIPTSEPFIDGPGVRVPFLDALLRGVDTSHEEEDFQSDLRGLLVMRAHIDAIIGMTRLRLDEFSKVEAD